MGGACFRGCASSGAGKRVLGAISFYLFAVLLGGATALLPALRLTFGLVTRQVGVYMFAGVAIFGL